MRTIKAILLLLALSLVAMPVDAVTSKKKKKKEAAAKEAAAKLQKKPEQKPQVERQGLLGVKKVKNEWFLEVPDSLLGRDMLATTRYVSTPSGSGKFGGELCNEQVVYCELNPDSTLLLRSRLTVNVADTADVISRAITVSNENPIIGAFKLEEHKKDCSKVKVSAFLNDDNALGIHSQIRTTFGLGALARDLSYVEDIKTFPTNTEVRLVKTYNSTSKSLPSAQATGKLTFVLNLSFILLPAEPMMPRHFDPRVGYFNHRFNAYTDGQQRVEQKIYAARWRLEPRPEDVERMRRGELVEPIKPIVYYIDPATPRQWRKYLIQGVNDWQVAFEKAGFKNAIRAEEWPEGQDSTMSMEDARYSVIRYLASPIPNAYGPHVSDPRTGEILESHICWYHNVMSLVHDWYMVQASSIDEAARKMSYDEELMGQLVRFVSSHEVGHTLGLRHNFGSSSTVPVDSLRNKKWVEAHGHTPSIMDYARFNYVAQPEDNISVTGIFPRINDYDLWAIEWGYRPMLDAHNADEDHQLLEPMTQRAQRNPRLWWGDGEGERDDPRRQTEDLGDDPVKASLYGIRNLQRELVNLDRWTHDERDIYDRNLSTMYGQITTQFLRYMGHVARYIGGNYINWRPRQEGGTHYEPTPLDRQKAAFAFLSEQLLTEPAWLREPHYATSLNSDPQNLTLGVARSGATLLTSRIGQLNHLYPTEQYVDDLVRMAFSETQSGKLVSKYRETLQNVIVDNLIQLFRSNTGAIRGSVLLALKNIQTKAQNYRGADAHSRAHYANMADLLARTLVVK